MLFGTGRSYAGNGGTRGRGPVCWRRLGFVGAGLLPPKFWKRRWWVDGSWSCLIDVSQRSNVQVTGRVSSDEHQGSIFWTTAVRLSWYRGKLDDWGIQLWTRTYVLSLVPSSWFNILIAWQATATSRKQSPSSMAPPLTIIVSSFCHLVTCVMSCNPVLQSLTCPLSLPHITRFRCLMCFFSASDDCIILVNYYYNFHFCHPSHVYICNLLQHCKHFVPTGVTPIQTRTCFVNVIRCVEDMTHLPHNFNEVHFLVLPSCYPLNCSGPWICLLTCWQTEAFSVLFCGCSYTFW
jgi:hypothetical protein